MAGGHEGREVYTRIHNTTYNATYPLGELPEWQLQHRVRSIQRARLIHQIWQRRHRELETLERRYVTALAALDDPFG
jgi:hypothetical protein